MANPSYQTLMDNVARAQQRLSEAQDRLSQKRDTAVRALDRTHELRRQRLLRRGEPGVPTDADVQASVTERDAAMADLQAVETDLGIQDAPSQQ